MSYDAECYCADLPKGEQCVFCEMETESRLKKLAYNLGFAGALCRAFIEGCKQTAAAVAVEDSEYEVEPELLTRPAWVPGCGRSAP